MNDRVNGCEKRKGGSVARHPLGMTNPRPQSSGPPSRVDGKIRKFGRGSPRNFHQVYKWYYGDRGSPRFAGFARFAWPGHGVGLVVAVVTSPHRGREVLPVAGRSVLPPICSRWADRLAPAPVYASTGELRSQLGYCACRASRELEGSRLHNREDRPNLHFRLRNL